MVGVSNMWPDLGKPSVRDPHAIRAKRVLFVTFQLITISIETIRALGFRLDFFSSLGLLLHRSNVRTLSKPPVPSGEPPKRGIKRRFSNAIDAAARPAHTGSGRGPRFAASVVRWWKNIHTRFEVHSCYGSRDINVLKWKFGKCAKWSLFSYPVTYSWRMRQWFCGRLIEHPTIVFGVA